MKQNMGKKFWLSLVTFSLMGQIAWVVENMYLNVFIYKIFKASPTDISIMVSMSAVTATVTTLLIGALSDKMGKRKIFICTGYIIWGISIFSFSLLQMDLLEGIAGSAVKGASLGVTLVILLDCVMTFFGSSANDACFNAWLTEKGNNGNRGIIEGINAMMPMLSILLVFGGFMAFDLEQSKSWSIIFSLIGCVVLLVGILGFFLIEDTKIENKENQNYFKNILYSFRLDVIKENKLLYTVVGAFAIFGISIQTFMPYLILYYEQSLQMKNYPLIMGPAVILSAAITVVYGKLYDMLGFKKSIYPTVYMLIIGYLLLFFTKSYLPVFLGSLFMMTGYLTGMAVFGAKIRDNTPENKAGLFQGLRIVGQVLIPGVIGPAIGAFVLKDAKQLLNEDGTTSFLPNQNIFLAAIVIAICLLIALTIIFRMVRNGHRILSTPFADNNDIPFSEYPRPQFRRDSFYCLNGPWENGILVPFPPQSFLSGYKKHVGQKLVYRKRFTLPEDFVQDTLLLHFGAVDQKASVYLNGTKIGSHEGGYLSFSFDITSSYKKGENELVVKVTDNLSTQLPYGKQCKNRGGMWYTPVSGIWQTVWMESVPKDYIEDIKITPDLTGVLLEVTTTAKEYTVIIHTPEKEIRKKSTKAQIRINLEEEGCIPNHWTPNTPFLYELTITTDEDKVNSYFALRTMDIQQIGDKKRICLNNKPIFLHGILDQGYFSDGIYLPASYKGYEFDILAMKKLGFNTLRKHIKVEPDYFYYLCDKLGMLVMQDMVNNGRYSFIRDTAIPTLGLLRYRDKLRVVSKKRRKSFIDHMRGTVHQLYNHPCMIYYTIFNEGWGQFDSDRMYDVLKELDNTRIIDTASGWFTNKNSDVESKHIYFRAFPLSAVEKPLVLSEFGGYSYEIKDHSYSLYNQHGYGILKDEVVLTERIVAAYEEMVLSSLENGLCGSVYTQLSDVEDEVNGLYTYDRRHCKVIPEQMQKLSATLYQSYQSQFQLYNEYTINGGEAD